MKWLTNLVNNRLIRRVVADAVHLIHVARQSKDRAEAIARDPDAAFKAAVRAAAAAAGYKISERAVEIAHLEVSRVLMGEATDDLKRKLASLDAMMARTAGKI